MENKEWEHYTIHNMVKAQRDQLREALLALRDDGIWVGGEWVPSEEAQSMADAALKATEEYV